MPYLADFHTNAIIYSESRMRYTRMHSVPGQQNELWAIEA
jgi:hypothetical protein